MPAPLKSEALEANLSVCFADSSPNRGALGRTGQPCCSLGLNRAQSAGPCSHWQRLRDCALPKSAGQAAVNLNNGARPFPIAENFARPARPLPTRQWLPYQGSWREAPERLYQRKPIPQEPVSLRKSHTKRANLQKNESVFVQNRQFCLLPFFAL